uniref:Uncharacterized protein n=1 Tax=Manihot esculenta TaxID=3983 RepID=A0A2C9V223_MANES
MPGTEPQASFLGIISIRRNQVDINHDPELEDLELFQRHVVDRFGDLLSPMEDVAASSETLLSISWLRKLVDVFLCCEAEFKAVLIMGCDPSQLCKPPAVKALDICNAVSSGVESVRQYQKFAEIAVSALEQKPMDDGQMIRRKVLRVQIEHGLSGGEGNTNSANKEQVPGYFRSLSMIVAKNWSASKQIQAMCSNLVPPRGGEPTGLALPVYVMSSVMVLVMWALVATLPCQERSELATHFQIPRQLTCAHSMTGLQEKIGEEWKKKEKKGSMGLLEEIDNMEKLALSLIDIANGFQFPGETEKIEEVAAQVAELAEICMRMEEGLIPLQSCRHRLEKCFIQL